MPMGMAVTMAKILMWLWWFVEFLACICYYISWKIKTVVTYPYHNLNKFMFVSIDVGNIQIPETGE